MVCPSNDDLHPKNNVQLGIIGTELEIRQVDNNWECAECLRDPAPPSQRKLQLSHSIADWHRQLSIRLDIQSAVRIQSEQDDCKYSGFVINGKWPKSNLRGQVSLPHENRT